MDIVDYQERLKRRILDELESVEEYILSGAPATMEDYKRIAGKREGLMLAKDIVSDVLKNANEEDD